MQFLIYTETLTETNFADRLIPEKSVANEAVMVSHLSWGIRIEKKELVRTENCGGVSDWLNPGTHSVTDSTSLPLGNLQDRYKAGKVETSGESPSFVREDEKLNWQKKNIFFVPVLDTARKTVLLESSLTIK